jgi:hypothetical protein
MFSSESLAELLDELVLLLLKPRVELPLLEVLQVLLLVLLVRLLEVLLLL